VVRAAFLIGFISCYVEDFALIPVRHFVGCRVWGLQLRARYWRTWNAYLDRDVAQIAVDS
jgi:hypothetical protein